MNGLLRLGQLLEASTQAAFRTTFLLFETWDAFVTSPPVLLYLLISIDVQ